MKEKGKYKYFISNLLREDVLVKKRFSKRGKCVMVMSEILF